MPIETPLYSHPELTTYAFTMRLFILFVPCLSLVALVVRGDAGAPDSAAKRDGVTQGEHDYYCLSSALQLTPTLPSSS